MNLHSPIPAPSFHRPASSTARSIQRQNAFFQRFMYLHGGFKYEFSMAFSSAK